jgi:hypothetical protein
VFDRLKNSDRVAEKTNRRIDFSLPYKDAGDTLGRQSTVIAGQRIAPIGFAQLYKYVIRPTVKRKSCIEVTLILQDHRHSAVRLPQILPERSVGWVSLRRLLQNLRSLLYRIQSLG